MPTAVVLCCASQPQASDESELCREIVLYGCPARPDPMEEGNSAVEHLKLIFDLCDGDRDGVITAEDFRHIGQEHFGKTQVGTLLIYNARKQLPPLSYVVPVMFEWILTRYIVTGGVSSKQV